MAIIENQAFGHVRFNITIIWIKSQKGKGYIFKIQWNFYSWDTLRTKTSVPSIEVSSEWRLKLQGRARVTLCLLPSFLCLSANFTVYLKKKIRESLQSKMAQAILSSYCTHLLQCILCPDQPSTMGSFLSWYACTSYDYSRLNSFHRQLCY